MEKSRTIPKKISKKVKQRHYFQCAWCCINITERHHITEFYKGGKHSEENLILLCSNCHTQVHNDLINKDELYKRKSTHLKNDRIAGSFVTNVTKLKLKIGSIFLADVPNILKFKEEVIIGGKVENDTLLLNLRFYDKLGSLIFWMSQNRFWFKSSEYEINSKIDELSIYDKRDGNFIKLRKIDDYLYLKATFYLNGIQQKIDENTILSNGFSSVSVSNMLIERCGVGIQIK